LNPRPWQTAEEIPDDELISIRASCSIDIPGRKAGGRGNLPPFLRQLSELSKVREMFDFGSYKPDLQRSMREHIYACVSSVAIVAWLVSRMLAIKQGFCELPSAGSNCAY
jgi:hypothetical protein